jgi:uncharacterized protein YuzE
MNLGYDSEMDSLYIGVAEEVSAVCIEISGGVVLDFDSQGSLTGIDIHRFSSLPHDLHIPVRIPVPAQGSGTAGSSNV